MSGFNSEGPFDKPDPFKSNKQNAYDTSHSSSDTDADRSAIHHTLGAGPNQAAPGNHKHKRVDITDLVANDVTDLAVPPFTNYTSASLITRRGSSCELFINCTTIAASGGGAAMIIIPIVHAPANLNTKYFYILDAATGLPVPVHQSNNAIYTTLGLGAGVHLLGHHMYLAAN